jgi:ectonucleotide pyrophosphatase/phosphodiesterase family protein 5
MMKRQIILFLCLLCSAVTAQEKQCTILISFDGFRWDYLNRGLTPTIDSLSKNGVRAASLEPVYPSKTFPNHIAIVTGMYSDHHGIIQNDFIEQKSGRRYKISDTAEVRDSRWYHGEAIWETAIKNGKISASYFWPGSELREPLRHPNYYEQYELTRSYTERINGTLKWAAMPVAQRPDVITLYFDATDTQGHKYGPNSPEVNASIAQLDSLVGDLIKGLRRLKMADSTNIILVSDHGMTEMDLSRVIVIDELLQGEKYKTQWSGSTMLIQSENGRDRQIVDILRKKKIAAKVYLKEEMPKYFHFSSSELIYPVVVAADLGWYLTRSAMTHSDSLKFEKGGHGYESHLLEMHGFFVASGPVFRKNYNVGTIMNIDIYPLLCKVLNIRPNRDIDGLLERIDYILR